MTVNTAAPRAGVPSEWMKDFCASYGPDMIAMAKLFLYAGLVMGIVFAAAQAYKLYREAEAMKAPRGEKGDVPAPGAGENVKALVAVLSAASAWLALAIVGIILLWLAGTAVPTFCIPQT